MRTYRNIKDAIDEAGREHHSLINYLLRHAAVDARLNIPQVIEFLDDAIRVEQTHLLANRVIKDELACDLNECRISQARILLSLLRLYTTSPGS